MRNIIASIDLGTSSIKIAVGEFIKDKLNILAASDTPSGGIKKGIIVDGDLVVKSIKIGMKKCEDLLGLKVTKAVVNVSSQMTEFTVGDGVCTVTNPDRVVGPSDIIMAIQASVYNKIPSQMELVCAIPTVFKVDNDEVVKDPKGMISTKLHVKTVVVMIPKKNVYPVISVMEKCGIKIIDIYLTSLGDYETNKIKGSEEKIGAIVNIGDETTTVSIFNKGVLVNTAVLEVGGKNVDNDFCFIYKIGKKDAKRIKENLALCHKRLADASEVETVTNKLGEEIKLNQYEVSEIMMSRLTETLEIVKKQINLLTKKEISYIIYTGGLTEARDFPLILESVYGHNVLIGSVEELGVRNNKYSTCVGMMKCLKKTLDMKNKEYSIFNIDELEELSSANKRINIKEDSIVGKVFGYFFDN